MTIPGRILLHKADAYTNYDWYSCLPEGTPTGTKLTILVTGVNGNMISDDYSTIGAETRKLFQGMTSRFGIPGLVLVCPVIPRSRSAPYTVYLNHESVTGSDRSLECRSDLRTLRILDELRGLLNEKGFAVDDRIVLEGFSAGAMFARHFALIHPELVKAVIGGQCGGFLTLPLESFGKRRLDWPVGIAGYGKAFGYPFNDAACREIRQFLYIGDADTENPTVSAKAGNDVFSDGQKATIGKLFGLTDPARLSSEAALLCSLGCSGIEFPLYRGMVHRRSAESDADLKAFLEKALDEP